METDSDGTGSPSPNRRTSLNSGDDNAFLSAQGSRGSQGAPSSRELSAQGSQGGSSEKSSGKGNAKLKAAAQEMMLGFGAADERAKKDALVVAAEAFADGTDFAFDKANASGGSTKRSKGSPSPFGSLKEEGSTKPLKALFSK